MEQKIRKKNYIKTMTYIQRVYDEKYAEYDKMSLDELKAFFEESKKSKLTRIGGTYKKAFLDVVSKKLQNKAIKETITVKNEENKQEETIGS